MLEWVIQDDLYTIIILDRRSQHREKNIAEVMGRYNDVPPIAKVSYAVIGDLDV